ncbi:MAG: peptide ABC transporter substrate-binding protein [Firmicutes bacterium]|nr:peptide ABC transporter substrate-binding protein [Bacillota bacterium]
MVKGKVRAAGAVALASAALFGTSIFGAGAPVASAASRVVVVPYPADNLETLDPIDWSGNILVDQGTIFTGLYGYNQQNQIVPEIAKKAVPSDGGLVWTIYLKHNWKWSNGQPVTAEDFYYAWMRLMSPTDTEGAMWAGVTNNILNAYAYHAGAVPASKVGLKVINPYELQITLDGATNITGLLALSASMPVYPPDVEAHPSDWYMPQYFVGDGPYVVSSFTPNGELVLTRNKYYHGTVGNVSQIDLIPSPSTGVEDYLANTLDATIIGTGSDYTYAKAHFPGQIHVAPDATINYLGWDKSVDPSPLDNPKVREAIAMAIDRGPIANPVSYGLVGVTNTFSYPGFPTYGLEHNPYSYNVAKARKLLAEAGYPDGKGIPTLQLYTQTSSNSPLSVLMGEAIAEQLKQALNINFKVDPTNATLWGELSWGGIEPGILPGYSLDVGTANWNQTLQWPLQSDQWAALLEDSGSVGSVSFRQHAELWNFYNYDPHDVKLFGNPNNANEGVSYSSWKPLIAAAEKDIAYLNAWTKKQPLAYQKAVNPPGTVPLTTELKDYEASYASAKTPAEKHAAWVSFWKWVGSYPNGGDSGASLGLNAQVYVDEHEPSLEYHLRIWSAELTNTPSATEAAKLSAEIANAFIKSGYAIPLNYSETVYLEKPNLTGLQPNPWAWGNFYQFQYMNLK